jgi:hypothetical protein
MIHDERTAHRDSHTSRDDPSTALHALRYCACIVALAVAILGAAVLAVGGATRDMHYWNLGLTLVGLGGMCGIVAAAFYACQLFSDQQREHEEHTTRELDKICKELAALSDQMRHSTNAVLAYLESLGEVPVVADTARGADDEFTRRRRGS